jgi:hypothetical protein
VSVFEERTAALEEGLNCVEIPLEVGLVAEFEGDHAEALAAARAVARA